MAVVSLNRERGSAGLFVSSLTLQLSARARAPPQLREIFLPLRAARNVQDYGDRTMKTHGRSYPILWLATLLLGAFACGGGGGDGGGESFIVTGLWTVAPTTAPATATPDNAFCNEVAAGVGVFPGREFQVTQLDGTLTATSRGDEFNGTVNEGDQSFQLTDRQPIDFDLGGGCHMTFVLNLDFFNAAGDSADPVNVGGGATGNSACPFQCTLVFPSTAVRS